MMYQSSATHRSIQTNQITHLEIDLNLDGLSLTTVHHLLRLGGPPLCVANQLHDLLAFEGSIVLMRELDRIVPSILELDKVVLPLSGPGLESNLVARVMHALLERTRARTLSGDVLSCRVVNGERRSSGEMKSRDEADLRLARVEEGLEGGLKRRERLRNDRALRRQSVGQSEDSGPRSSLIASDAPS